MSTITGIDKLKLSEEQIGQLIRQADKNKAESSITFNIRYANEDIIEIESRQNKNRSGKYATDATLIKRTRELFSKFLPQFQLIVLPVTYLPSPTSAVSPIWLDQKMQEKGIRIKQISYDTGVDRETISDWVTGKRKMSQIVKAMFYFYLSK